MKTVIRAFFRTLRIVLGPLDHASFRRFLLFARDTIRWKKPMEPDIHWSAMAGHVSTYIVNGGRYDNIFFTEKFDEGMGAVLKKIKTKFVEKRRLSLFELDDFEGTRDAARAIRQRPGADNILMIALTGWGQEDDKLKAEAAGFDFADDALDFVLKFSNVTWPWIIVKFFEGTFGQNLFRLT